MKKLNTGKLIVIEGVDGVGKETQSKLLADALKKEGYDVILLSFPSYGTIQAKPLELYLQGELGGMDYLSSEEISALYALDRSVTIRHMDIINKLKEGYIVIADRYTESNIIYQIAKLKEYFNPDLDMWGIEMCQNMLEMQLTRSIETLEKGVFKIPESDLVLYLDMSRENSKKLLDKRNNEKDIHEKDDAYLEKVSNVGRRLAKTFNWSVIDCENSDTTEVLSKDDIHSKIMDIVNNNIDKWV